MLTARSVRALHSCKYASVCVGMCVCLSVGSVCVQNAKTSAADAVNGAYLDRHMYMLILSITVVISG